MATRFQNDSFGTDTETSCRQQATTPVRRATARQRWTRALLLAAAVTSVVGPTSGCTILRGVGKRLSEHEMLDQFMVDYRNRAWSSRAWLCRKDQFRGHAFLSDFEAGFRQGYEDIAAGGTGCVPAVCPRAYWGWQYQSANGQSRMNAWFEAYPLGVKAAEEDGIGHWGNVATSFTAPAACQNCPTGAVMAVPAVADPEPQATGPSVIEQPGRELGYLDGEQAETIAPPLPADADQLPVPLSEPRFAPGMPGTDLP